MIDNRVVKVPNQVQEHSWTNTVNYLEKRFSSLRSLTLSDFTVFDHRNLPVQRGERAAYGNAEVKRLVDHLSQEERDGAVKEWQELKSFLATQSIETH